MPILDIKHRRLYKTSDKKNSL